MDSFKSTYDKYNKIWTGPSMPSPYNYECSVGRIIFNQLKKFPNKICQIDDISNTTLTNREVLTSAIRIAQHLKDMKLRQDEIIGISAKHTTYLLPLTLACYFNCSPFHAVNPMLDEDTLKHCFELTKPQLIFCDGDEYQKIRAATKSFKPKIITLSQHVEDVIKISDFLEPTRTEMYYQPAKYSFGGHQTVAIVCSSGTTGKPKAVCVSAALVVYDNPFIDSESIMYLPSGIDWLSGLIFMVQHCLSCCTRIISNKPFSTDYFFELMKKYRMTYLFLAPPHLAALVNHPLANKEIFSSVRSIQVGGSALSEKTVESLKPLLQNHAILTFGYGMSEFGGIAACINSVRGDCVGTLIPNVRVRIVDENGKNLGPNETGEIYVHNPTQSWSGYYGNPLETQRMRDAHDWLHTGDLGYMDDAHNLYLIDRKKEIRKFQGNHFWPKEIEDTIMELPNVVEAISDEIKGDCSGALVVKAAKSSLNEKDIIDYVKKRLIVAQKQIHSGVYFVDKIPQNLNGKISRMEAKEIFQTLLNK